MGLNWSFLAAGVPTVVATQWPLHDSTALEAMEMFYQHLARGELPVSALGKTQRAMIEDGGFSISQWGAYVTVGWPGQATIRQARYPKLATSSQARALASDPS